METTSSSSQPRGVAQVAEVLSEQIVKALETKETELDEEIKNLEHADEDELERIRERRLRELRKNANEREKWKLVGHGEYEEVDERDFFNVSKQSPLMVVHFYRPSTPRCQILDEHYSRLAKKHLETRFIKINAEKSPFLADRLNIKILPTTVVVKDGKAGHSIVGFEEFGGTDDFKTSVVETVLEKWEVIGVKPRCSAKENDVD